MKKSTYDALSLIAVVAVVVFTFSAQYSSRGYVFGILAVLTAAGMLAAYIKALPAGPQKSEKKTQAVEAVRQLEPVAQREGLTRAVREDLYRKLIITERDRAARTFESVLRDRLRDRISVSPHPDLKAGSYYTYVRFSRNPVHDPATIIANIIEKLCASSNEPRFEFILGPDGSFKIQQISPKRDSIGHVTEQEEPAEQEVREANEPQVVN